MSKDNLNIHGLNIRGLNTQSQITHMEASEPLYEYPSDIQPLQDKRGIYILDKNGFSIYCQLN